MTSSMIRGRCRWVARGGLGVGVDALEQHDPALPAALDKLVDPDSRGIR
ncbi:MAG: hypothetical protein ACRDS0_22405 [Pseudonocardiaceae bacterium]